MKQICFFIAATIFSISAFSQDYVKGTKNTDGFTSVSKTVYIKSGYYSNSVTRYGLLNEKTNKLVLPVQYSAAYVSWEPGIYIIKDTNNRVGLYAATAQKFLVEPKYYGIEGFSDGLAVVKLQKQPFGFLWGAVDKNGATIIPVEYDYLGPYKDGLMNFSKGGHYGFLDKDNKIVIPATYGNLSSFYNGLAPVKVNETGKYGYIDKGNNMVIPAQYVYAEEFYKGYAVVTRKLATAGKNTKNNDAEVALIDAKGKELTGFDYNSISLYMDGGLFSVSKDKNYGVIDSTGKLILPVEYSNITTHSPGRLLIKTTALKYGLMDSKGTMLMKPEYDYISPVTADRFYFKKNNRFSVMDKNMKLIIPADSVSSIHMGNNRIGFVSTEKAKFFDLNGRLVRTVSQANIAAFGCGFIADQDSFRIKYDASVQLTNLASNTKKMIAYSEAGDFNEEGIFLVRKVKYNFFDITGKKLSPVDYYSAVNFSDGICALQETSSSVPYLADKNFKKIKDLSVVFYGPYSEGIAMGLNTNARTVVYLDKKGEQVFSVSGKEGGKCTNGRIWIKSNSDTYFWVDAKGKWIGNQSWSAIGEFSDGLAPVSANNKWGFIDTTGKLVIPTQFDVVTGFTQGIAVAQLQGKYFQINKKGETIDSKSYDGAATPANGTFIFSKDKKAGLVDTKGNTIIDFKYDNILPLAEERTWAVKAGKWALLDSKGKELTGFLYDAGGSFENGYSPVKLKDKWGLVNKSGKLVLPTEYTNLGKVYKNTVIAVVPEGSLQISLK